MTHEAKEVGMTAAVVTGFIALFVVIAFGSVRCTEIKAECIKVAATPEQTLACSNISS